MAKKKRTCGLPSLQPSLELSRAEGSSMAILNCQVKAGRGDGSVDLEITATNHTKVEASPRKFTLPTPSEAAEEEPMLVQLSNVHGLAVNQHVHR